MNEQQWFWSNTAVLTVLHKRKVVQRPKMERTLSFAIIHINMAVFLPCHAIAGISHCNQRWPKAK